MPAAIKGARLYLRAAKGNRGAVWIIRDGTHFTSTGCAPDARDAAEQRLAGIESLNHGQPDVWMRRAPT